MDVVFYRQRCKSAFNMKLDTEQFMGIIAGCRSYRRPTMVSILNIIFNVTSFYRDLEKYELLDGNSKTYVIEVTTIESDEKYIYTSDDPSFIEGLKIPYTWINQDYRNFVKVTKIN